MQPKVIYLTQAFLGEQPIPRAGTQQVQGAASGRDEADGDQPQEEYHLEEANDEQPVLSDLPVQPEKEPEEEQLDEEFKVDEQVQPAQPVESANEEKPAEESHLEQQVQP